MRLPPRIRVIQGIVPSLQTSISHFQMACHNLVHMEQLWAKDYNAYPSNVIVSWITCRGAPSPIISFLRNVTAPKMNPKIWYKRDESKFIKLPFWVLSINKMSRNSLQQLWGVPRVPPVSDEETLLIFSRMMLLFHVHGVMLGKQPKIEVC